MIRKTNDKKVVKAIALGLATMITAGTMNSAVAYAGTEDTVPNTPDGGSNIEEKKVVTDDEVATVESNFNNASADVKDIQKDLPDNEELDLSAASDDLNKAADKLDLTSDEFVAAATEANGDVEAAINAQQPIVNDILNQTVAIGQIANEANEALDNANAAIASATSVAEAEKIVADSKEAAESAKQEYEDAKAKYDEICEEYDNAVAEQLAAEEAYQKAKEAAESGKQEAIDELKKAEEDLAVAQAEADRLAKEKEEAMEEKAKAAQKAAEALTAANEEAANAAKEAEEAASNANKANTEFKAAKQKVNEVQKELLTDAKSAMKDADTALNGKDENGKSLLDKAAEAEKALKDADAALNGKDESGKSLAEKAAEAEQNYNRLLNEKGELANSYNEGSEYVKSAYETALQVQNDNNAFREVARQMVFYSIAKDMNIPYENIKKDSCTYEETNDEKKPCSMTVEYTDSEGKVLSTTYYYKYSKNTEVIDPSKTMVSSNKGHLTGNDKAGYSYNDFVNDTKDYEAARAAAEEIEESRVIYEGIDGKGGFKNAAEVARNNYEAADVAYNGTADQKGLKDQVADAQAAYDNAQGVARVLDAKNKNNESWAKRDDVFDAIVEEYYVSHVLAPGATNVVAAEFKKFGDSGLNYSEVTYDIDGETKTVRLNYRVDDYGNLIIFEKDAEGRNSKFESESSMSERNAEYLKWLEGKEKENKLKDALNNKFDAQDNMNLASAAKTKADNEKSTADQKASEAKTAADAAATEADEAKRISEDMNTAKDNVLAASQRVSALKNQIAKIVIPEGNSPASIAANNQLTILKGMLETAEQKLSDAEEAKKEIDKKLAVIDETLDTKKAEIAEAERKAAEEAARKAAEEEARRQAEEEARRRAEAEANANADDSSSTPAPTTVVIPEAEVPMAAAPASVATVVNNNAAPAVADDATVEIADAEVPMAATVDADTTSDDAVAADETANGADDATVEIGDNEVALAAGPAKDAPKLPWIFGAIAAAAAGSGFFFIAGKKRKKEDEEPNA